MYGWRLKAASQGAKRPIFHRCKKAIAKGQCTIFVLVLQCSAKVNYEGAIVDILMAEELRKAMGHQFFCLKAVYNILCQEFATYRRRHAFCFKRKLENFVNYKED